MDLDNFIVHQSLFLFLLFLLILGVGCRLFLGLFWLEFFWGEIWLIPIFGHALDLEFEDRWLLLFLLRLSRLLSLLLVILHVEYLFDGQDLPDLPVDVMAEVSGLRDALIDSNLLCICLHFRLPLELVDLVDSNIKDRIDQFPDVFGILNLHDGFLDHRKSYC